MLWWKYGSWRAPLKQSSGSTLNLYCKKDVNSKFSSSWQAYWRILATAKRLILICVDENGGGKLRHERSDRFSWRAIFWSVAIETWGWIKPDALVLFQSSRKPTWFTNVLVFGPIIECSPYNYYARSGKMWFMLTIWLHWETGGFTHFCSWINYIFKKFIRDNKIIGKIALAFRKIACCWELNIAELL